MKVELSTNKPIDYRDGKRQKMTPTTAPLRREIICQLEPLLNDEISISLPTKNNVSHSTSCNDRDIPTVISIPNSSGSSTLSESTLRGKNGRQLIPKSQRSSILTYPLRVVDQLRLCERISTQYQFSAGFECKHCCGHEKWQRFPETFDEVCNDIMAFREHLNNECLGCPQDTRSYLNWIENGYKRACHIGGTKGYFRLTKRLDKVATLVGMRLDKEEAKGNEALAKARKHALMKKRKCTHSVLESVGSFD